MLRPLILSLCLALPVAAQTVPQSPAEISLSFAPVVRQAAPAVVNIYASVVVQERVSPFMGDPFFEQLFGDHARTVPRVQNALGSGVIVDPSGIVVSNYHVVGQATEIRVELSDRRQFTAHVLLADEESDLAVLQLEDATALPALAFRDSDQLEVGELVLAIGNPFGVGQTVSSGIVSALARSTMSLGSGFFIQTDAAINPGNSGGALVDVNGRLLGINTAILTRGGGSNGIGFAIPANLVRSVVEQAKAGNSQFQRPWAGITAQAMDSDMADALGLARPEGTVVDDLHPDSPFAAVGVKPGDAILSLGGLPADSPQEMIYRLASIGIGKTVPVTWLSRGEERTAEIRLIPPPDSPPRQPLTLGRDSVLAGLSVANVNPAVMAELGLSADAAGVAVTGVEGRAARIGLRPGDVVLAVNGVAVANTSELAMLAGQQVRRWRIDLQRGSERLALNFRL